MGQYGPPIAVGILAGTLARLFLLRVDFRQYPSYPQAYATHLFLGFIAAAVGAVAVPALVSLNFQAATFLILAAQQFREVREMERQSLSQLEETELVARGTAYIEGIAKVFEARNYLAMICALVASALAFSAARWGGVFPWLAGGAGGCLSLLLLEKVMQGEKLGDYARIKIAPLTFRGADLYVGEIFLANVGRAETREVYLQAGLGAILEPVDLNARATLAHPGQRQAIAHDLAALLGVRKDADEPEFTPLVRLHHPTGRLGLVVVPLARDEDALVEALRRIPLIEGAKRKPLAAGSGRLAARRSP